MKTAALLAFAINLIGGTGHAVTSPNSAKFDLNKVIGTHQIKSCIHTENFEEAPQDYYCNMTSLSLVKIGLNSFMLTFINELGESETAPIFEEYSQRNATTIDEAEFIAIPGSITWARHFSDSENKIRMNDNYEFIKENDGQIYLNHTFSYHGAEASKLHTWDYELR